MYKMHLAGALGRALRIPPNGHSGHAQQTPATHMNVARALMPVLRGFGPPKRRTRKATMPRRVKRPKIPGRFYANSGRMKKGSAAAKAWGRKMKRMRGRR